MLAVDQLDVRDRPLDVLATGCSLITPVTGWRSPEESNVESLTIKRHLHGRSLLLTRHILKACAALRSVLYCGTVVWTYVGNLCCFSDLDAYDPRLDTPRYWVRNMPQSVAD
jgi:hypothetical protein